MAFPRREATTQPPGFEQGYRVTGSPLLNTMRPLSSLILSPTMEPLPFRFDQPPADKRAPMGWAATTFAGGSSLRHNARTEVVTRTVHLRCLPPFLPQKVLADIFDDCGVCLRVRICGNAATHQKWVYGFVEFATVEAAQAMVRCSGMELPNGVDKPPLRLKCSPSKQPILDCMAYDADVVSGTPCGFGRGFLAACTLNDALLVVGGRSSGIGAATMKSADHPGDDLVGASGGGCCGGADTDRDTTAAQQALTALTIRAIRKVAATGCGCGCAGVNCCCCCRCWKGTATADQAETEANGATATAGTAAGRVGCQGCCTADTVTSPVTAVTYSGGVASSSFSQDAKLSSAAALPDPCDAIVTASGADDDSDVLQQVTAAVQNLRHTAAVGRDGLDGSAIVRRAELMTMTMLHQAGQLRSDARIQDVLGEVSQLLAFLDAHAAVTGGAAQTAAGDCTATLPQRVTQLRMLAQLYGVLLCLLRRSVTDAVPYVEAALTTFAQIPLAKLSCVSSQGDIRASRSPLHRHEGRDVPFAGLVAPLRDGKETTCWTVRHHHTLGGARRDSLHGTTANSLLGIITDEEDEEHNDGERIQKGSPLEKLGSPQTGSREVTWSSIGSDSVGRAWRGGLDEDVFPSSDQNGAAVHTADLADLRDRDAVFWRYVLNVVVAVGLAMEAPQPPVARCIYTLANTRSKEVLGESSEKLQECLRAAPSLSPLAPPAASPPPVDGPHLCTLVFADGANTADRGKERDIAFVPQKFLERVHATRQRWRDVPDTECFWRELPPNFVVTLF